MRATNPYNGAAGGVEQPAF